MRFTGNQIITQLLVSPPVLPTTFFMSVSHQVDRNFNLVLPHSHLQQKAQHLTMTITSESGVDNNTARVPNVCRFPQSLNTKISYVLSLTCAISQVAGKVGYTPRILGSLGSSQYLPVRSLHLDRTSGDYKDLVVAHVDGWVFDRD